MYFFRRSAAGRFCLLLLAGFGLLWALSHALPPYVTGPDLLEPPSQRHWLGTNDLGQDVALGVLHAGLATAAIGLVTGLLSLSISLAAGSLAAIAPGPVGGLVLRVTDLFQIIPSILILLLVGAWFQPGAVGVVLLLGLTGWQDDVRPVRAILIRESRRENVAIVRALGASWPYLLSRHILPAIMPALAGLYLQNVGQAIMRVAGLAFLGLTDPRLLTWGAMIRSASDYLHEPVWVWLLLPPATALSVLLTAIMMAGRAFEGRGAEDSGVSGALR